MQLVNTMHTHALAVESSFYSVHWLTSLGVCQVLVSKYKSGISINHYGTSSILMSGIYFNWLSELQISFGWTYQTRDPL